MRVKKLEFKKYMSPMWPERTLIFAYQKKKKEH